MSDQFCLKWNNYQVYLKEHFQRPTEGGFEPTRNVVPRNSLSLDSLKNCIVLEKSPFLGFVDKCLQKPFGK